MDASHRAISRRQLLSAIGASATLAACSSGKVRSATPGPSLTPIAPTTGPASPSPPVQTLDALSAQLSKPLLRRGDAAFTSSAPLFNPRFDSMAKPLAIAACSGADDVVTCVRYAASSGMPFALRAGGHSYGGWSTSSGLVVDVRAMNSIDVDLASGTARVGAGASLSSVYAGLAAKGVGIAAGSCPTVGITGLTLGGGVGVLTRGYGLTCDLLRSVEIVTADGSLRTVDASHGEDLFWALRGGGGGSFGAVTALTFAVIPAPRVSLFYFRWDIAHGSAVIDAWQNWMAKASNQLWSSAKLLADPGSSSANAIVAGTWIGPPNSLQAQLDPLLAAIGTPPADMSMSTQNYLQAMLAEGECGTKSAQECAAAALTPSERLPFSATSAILPKPLPSAGISAAVASAMSALEVPHLVEGGMSFDALGGTVSKVASTDSAFAYRDATATIQFSATWSGSRPTEPFDNYARTARTSLLPWTGDTAYANYADPSLKDYPTAYWAGNSATLQQVKKTYDPGDLFTFPQSVKA